MKKLLVSLLFTVSLSVVVSGQHIVKGIIVDAENGSPLPGAHITVENSFIGTFSTKNGNFELKIRHDTDEVLIVSFIGYEKKSIKIPPKEVKNLRIELKPLPLLQNEVIIEAVRLNDQMPFSFENISKSKLKEYNFGQDIPQILEQSVSLVSTSDAGTGIGYTGFRIRGSDLSRVNITLNGIPLNDAESHGVWFVDIPDLANAVNSIQIQRGTGTSSNGAGAFGANVNILTASFSESPYAEISSDVGSFSTLKTSIASGTGLLANNFSFDFRISKQNSDGFIDRAFANLNSVFFNGAYYSKKSLIRFSFIWGEEKTYQAWNGIPKVKLLNDSLGMKRYFEHGLYSLDEYQHMLNSETRTYNFYTYENETDNYTQTHYQLHFSSRLNTLITFNSAFHYTKGLGYYEQYKTNQKYSKYGLQNPVIGNDTITKTDLIRQKWLDNHFYGIIWSLSMQPKHFSLIVGGSANEYLGDHYGYIIWAKNAMTIPKNHRWYLNTGDKTDVSSFAKINLPISKDLSYFADIQYRYIHYKINGIHDDLRDISTEKSYHFINPKTGLFYLINSYSQAYLSFGIASREPSRNEFRDADEHYHPLPEKLYDFEAGGSFTADKLVIRPNLFFMYYDNQLVHSGKINDVGSPIMINVPQSYRTGFELTSKYQIQKNIAYELNFTYSKNKIKDFTEYVDDWDNGGQKSIYHKITDISFSPEIIFSGILSAKVFKNGKIVWLSKYVGKQFIDNTSNPENSLDAYLVNDLIAAYSLNLMEDANLTISFKVNNLFNHQYESNAWVYRYYYEGKFYTMDGYFPQAGRFYLFSLDINFGQTTNK